VWRSAAQAAGAGDWEAPDGVHEGAGRRRGWRHGPEPEGGGNQMVLGGCGLGTAPEDGGPGGWVVGKDRSFGAVTGLVVKGADVAGQARG
jgi:hypothetical protein